MGYQVLARKYRPQRFADVAGQEHVTRTLMNALSLNRIAHGYIFSGHRGIGKTTIARILAQALNCRTEIGSASPARPTPEPCGECDSCNEIRQGNAVDVIEIDAATNRGIDEIRELREAARYSPARDRYKIYILDEAHQITDAAFNALLKTLEEPPAHVVFMMATTEPENIPQTIRSRCQHFSFHAVKFDDILAQLRMIAGAEQVRAEDPALALLAEAGDGSMRDALSIMDQAIASAPVEGGQPVLSAGQIRDLMGSVPNAVFERLMEAVAAGTSAELMEQLDTLLNAGNSPLSLARQMVRYLRNALMAKLGGEQTELMQISTDERARAARTALLFSEEELTRALQIVLRTFDELNYRQEQRFHLEIGLLKLIHAQRLLPVEEILSGLASGRIAAPTPAAQRPSAPVSSAATNTPAIAPNRNAPAKPGAPSDSISPFASATAAATGTAKVVRIDEPAHEAATAPIATGVVTTDGALARAPHQVDVHLRAGQVNLDALREGVAQALETDGHSSAATFIANGRWSLDGSNLRIEVAAGKKMIGLTFNAAAEKIIRQSLQAGGMAVRFMILPGEGLAAANAATAPSAPRGSIQQAALEHPLVRHAQTLFNAEVRGVLDLREK